MQQQVNVTARLIYSADARYSGAQLKTLAGDDLGRLLDPDEALRGKLEACRFEILELQEEAEIYANTTDADLAPYDVHRRRLEAEGFRLGADRDGFDVYRSGDCSGARAWINYKGEDPHGQSQFVVTRGALAGSRASVTIVPA